MLIGLYALELALQEGGVPRRASPGLFGYLGGAVAANAMLGHYTVDHFGWDGGFMVLTVSCVLSIILLAMTLKHENESIAAKAAAPSGIKRDPALSGFYGKDQGIINVIAKGPCTCRAF